MPRSLHVFAHWSYGRLVMRTTIDGGTIAATVTGRIRIRAGKGRGGKRDGTDELWV